MRAAGYCAGIVMSGSRPFSPVSASVKKNITAVSALFASRFPFSIQYQ